MTISLKNMMAIKLKRRDSEENRDKGKYQN